MNILIVNTYYYPEIVGGAEYSVKKLAEQLIKMGHCVTVFCTGDYDFEEDCFGVHIIRRKTKHVFRVIHGVGKGKWISLYRNFQDIWNNKNSSIIEEVINLVHPDIIHTNGLYDISPIVWKIAKKHSIRVIHTLRDYMMHCPIVSFICSGDRKKCPDRLRKHICSIHRFFNKLNTKYVDCVTAPSLLVLDTICGKKYFKNSKQLVIPNAIDYDENQLNDIAMVKKNKKLNLVKFIYLGTLDEKKGIRLLLETFSKMNRETCELWIAGKGELEKYVIEESKNNKSIHFVGFLEEKSLNTLLDEMDVLVCPSLWNEPFGRVVLDAYKHAMPVIGSNRGALPELINCNTGIIFDPLKNDSLYDSMNYFVSNKDEIKKYIDPIIIELKKYSLQSQCELFIDNAYNESEVKK